jgi:hypothetical protein
MGHQVMVSAGRGRVGPLRVEILLLRSSKPTSLLYIQETKTTAKTTASLAGENLSD